MQKVKMILVAGVLVAITVLSIAGLCFSDDAQPAPDATTEGATMSNVSTTPPPAPAPAPEPAPEPEPGY